MDDYLKEALEIARAQASVRVMSEDEITSFIQKLAQGIRNVAEGDNATDIDGGDVVAIEVKPSLYPPVRYRGVCYIRTGPRRDIASVGEEKLLIERRASYAKTFDLVPALGATEEDVSETYFTLSYLPLAIDGDTLQRNGRDTKQKMAALRFWDLKSDCPTNAGILMFGLNPLFFLPGAYIQYIRFEGEEMTDAVGFEKRFSGALISELKNIDDFVKDNIIKEKVVRQGSFQ